MGIRSEVGFAAKPNVVENLSEEARATITRYFGKPQCQHEEGTLWFVEGIKWYCSTYDDLISLYAELGRFHDEDYIIVEACYDYPTSDEGCIGEWHDNPWNMHREVSARVFVA